jgi:hypothetical protein
MRAAKRGEDLGRRVLDLDLLLEELEYLLAGGMLDVAAKKIMVEGVGQRWFGDFTGRLPREERDRLFSFSLEAVKQWRRRREEEYTKTSARMV